MSSTRAQASPASTEHRCFSPSSLPPACRSDPAACGASGQQQQPLQSQRRQHRQLEPPTQLQHARFRGTLGIVQRGRRPTCRSNSTAPAAAWRTGWTSCSARSAPRRPDCSAAPTGHAIPSSSARSMGRVTTVSDGRSLASTHAFERPCLHCLQAPGSLLFLRGMGGTP